MKELADLFQYLLENPGVTWSGAGTYVVSAFLGLAGAGLSWFVIRLLRKKNSSGQHDADEWFVKNRHKLLDRLQWELDTRLQSFLAEKKSLDLDKKLAPNQVAHPHSRQDSIAYTLERDGVAVESTDQSLVDLFFRPEVGQRLAILGKPGGGKTVCLLRLVEHLLGEAETDKALLLPVVFECSEWDGRELLPWMAYQLRRRYEIQEDTALRLIQERDILPLFDGLDELAADRQGEFVRHFNALPADRPQVVCCRVKEYDHLRENAGQTLALSNAVILQDISRQRLKGHLRRAGLNDLWALLEQSESEVEQATPAPAKEGQAEQPQSLLQLVQQPLFLGIMIDVAEKLRQGFNRRQGESWEDLLWRLYLNDCLLPRTPKPKHPQDAYDRKYAEAPSRHWLGCLASWMQAEDTVELQIDELQPSMLQGYWRFGLLYGLVVALAVGLVSSLFAGLVIGAAVGLAPGLFFGLPGCLPRKWATTITIGLAFGLFGWLAIGPVYGLFCGLIIMLVQQNNNRIRIEPLRPLRLPASWKDGRVFATKVVTWLSIGLALGLLVGLVSGLGQTQRVDLMLWLAACVSAATLPVGLLGGLALGLQAVAGKLNRTARPKDRLREALRSSIVLFPLFLLAAMLVFVQGVFLVLGEQWGIGVTPLLNMRSFYVVLLVTAILSLWMLGTDAVLQHYLLRYCLRLEGQLPLNLVPWLDALHQRKVLQRVGGSYHFLHKQLQDYLAKQHL